MERPTINLRGADTKEKSLNKNVEPGVQLLLQETTCPSAEDERERGRRSKRERLKERDFLEIGQCCPLSGRACSLSSLNNNTNFY
jgi:hypothetical protein